MSGQPPMHVDISERTFYGLTLRTGLILTASGCLVLGLLLGEIGLPFYLRAGLAIGLAGLGLSWAFGQIQGRHPEAWLGEVLAFRRRRRHFVHGAQKQPNGRLRVAMPAETEPAARRRPWPFRRPTLPAFLAPRATRHNSLPVVHAHPKTRPAAGVFHLSANVLGASLLTGLTLYLLQGGATRLLSLLRPF